MGGSLRPASAARDLHTLHLTFSAARRSSLRHHRGHRPGNELAINGGLLRRGQGGLTRRRSAPLSPVSVLTTLRCCGRCGRAGVARVLEYACCVFSLAARRCRRVAAAMRGEAMNPVSADKARAAPRSPARATRPSTPTNQARRGRLIGGGGPLIQGARCGRAERLGKQAVLPSVSTQSTRCLRLGGRLPPAAGRRARSVVQRSRGRRPPIRAHAAGELAQAASPRCVCAAPSLSRQPPAARAAAATAIARPCAAEQPPRRRNNRRRRTARRRRRGGADARQLAVAAMG